MSAPTIVYTKTDEAPALATASLLPIVEAFANAADIQLETRDISLAGRLLAAFSEFLPPDKRVSDDLAYLQNLVTQKDANIIKLPNISASVPQLRGAIEELRKRGYDLPDYPQEPKTETERAIRERYDAVKGSAVNPVLREGNSDRRAPEAVKQYARKNPHSMGAWSATSRSHVATMTRGDFRSNEASITVPRATRICVQHVDKNGTITPLIGALDLKEGEVFDGTVMEKRALISFLKEQITDARDKKVLFSLHLKATMMKVSDPILFGHAVRVYFADLFDKHAQTLKELKVNVNNGFGVLLAKIDTLPDDKREEIKRDIAAIRQAGPSLAMVNSDKDITNLHVPSDVIVDASMPAMIRSSGCMWNAAGQLQDTKAVIPDSSYAGIYQTVIDFCKKHGAFDPKTMGTVPNVGLMAQQAEEYGSHDKTFEIASAGYVRVVDEDGNCLMEHAVDTGDVWRGCQTKDPAIADWVELAVRRARSSNTPAVFWLDETRPHDAELIRKVNEYLGKQNTTDLDIRILAPELAMEHTLDRVRDGKDTISVTGNVLRDYLTDLFPILELGTSAKMLSIVPLMSGGGLFETGAGGSAPKHVQQFLAEGHLRWDSLGEFLALGASLEHVAEAYDHAKARVMAQALNDATAKLLLNGKSPLRKVHELDNRGSHFYLALYWAQALAEQTQDAALQERFAPTAQALAESEEAILKELDASQGSPVDLGGYYWPTTKKLTNAMRPSSTLNQLIGSI